MNLFFVLDEVRFIHPRVSFVTFDQTFPVISNFLTFHVSSSQLNATSSLSVSIGWKIFSTLVQKKTLF